MPSQRLPGPLDFVGAALAPLASIGVVVRSGALAARGANTLVALALSSGGD
jgi:hypothetical protein